MSVWKTKLSNLIENADDFSDKIRSRLRKIKGYDDHLSIIAYLGYGTNEKFFLRGRVTENKGAVPVSQTDGKRRNLANLLRRFATDEVPFARVSARYKDAFTEVVADDEGYFQLEINLSETTADAALFREIELELIEPVGKNGEIARALGQVLVPPATARFGVISDLDDTVITTNVTNKLKMLLTVALLNEHTRVPFEGVAAFYRALRKGVGDEHNPIFYVSSSPWNLYPFLTEFLKLHDIPRGTLFLKDFGSHTLFNAGDHKTHKLENIEIVLKTYSQLPFVLIGDSGEQDPEIYREIVRKYPDRIRAIYIRSVDQRAERLAAIDKLVAEVSATGCQLVLAPDTEFVAAHAAAEGLIAAEELVNIRAKKQKDATAPTAQEIESAEI